VDTSAQEVVASRLQFGGVTALRVRSEQQPDLQKAGDFVRIDCGYLYVVAPPSAGLDQVITTRRAARNGFAETGSIPTDDLETPEPAGDWDGPTLAYRFNLGKVSSTSVSRYVVLAYDESLSVQYLDRWLRPFWRRKTLALPLCSRIPSDVEQGASLITLVLVDAEASVWQVLIRHLRILNAPKWHNSICPHARSLGVGECNVPSLN
jgi:hypothetical protein